MRDHQKSLPLRDLTGGHNNICGPFIFSSYIHEAYIHENFLHWSGDGLRLVFNRSEVIWSLSVDDSTVTPVANANPGMET